MQEHDFGLVEAYYNHSHFPINVPCWMKQMAEIEQTLV